MAPRKRAGSKKKEVLPDPTLLSNGECDYYIGAWSTHQSLDAISEIAHSVMAQHASECERGTGAGAGAGAENRKGKDPEEIAATLPRTVILIPACELGEAGTRYAVEVANKMHIESIPKSSMKSVEEVVRETNAAAEGEGEGDVGVENEEAAGNKNENNNETSYLVQQDVGASLSAREVIIHGSIHIDGILTPIVVKPDLPEPPVVPKQRKKSIKGKKNSKAFEEEQKRLADEAQMYEEKVNAAISAAREEEERRMKFAHPNRWSHVVFSNMTFTGQVIVSHAHVKFQNCCFAASNSEITQLLVAQYCEVECIKCTFECPIKGSVYGWPMSQIKLLKCLFTGISQNISNDKIDSNSPLKFCLNSVGLHTDDCKVQVEGCHFKYLGTGIVLRGKFFGKNDSSNPSMIIKGCNINNIFGTGIVLDKVYGVEIVKNKFSDCEYYALDCVKGKGIHVFQNSFLSQVRVQDTAHVKLLHNKTETVPLNLKEIENPNWQPVY